MKFTLPMVLTLFSFNVYADSFSSRSKFICGPDNNKVPYILELAIDDVGDQTGTVKVLKKSDSSLVRKEEAFYQHGNFYFSNDIEHISIGSYDSFGDEFEVIYGNAEIKELNGSIHCKEVNY